MKSMTVIAFFGRNTMKRIVWIVILLTLPAAAIFADSVSLNRNELTEVKRKLQAVLTALGTPPAGYSKINENFNIATEANAESGGFSPAQSSAEFLFGGEGQKIAAEYQKKIMDAQARGDYAAMQRLSQELQAKVTASAVPEIRIEIIANQSDSITADPDSILLEKPGTMAVATNNDEMDFRAAVYFHPKALSGSSQAARIEISLPESIRTKTGIVDFVVRFTGPADLVKKWISKIQHNAVLSNIDAR